MPSCVVGRRTLDKDDDTFCVALATGEMPKETQAECMLDMLNEPAASLTWLAQRTSDAIEVCGPFSLVMIFPAQSLSVYCSVVRANEGC